jgi:2-C-methyl-D-erythritol 4-phosphate cytidylyltransferase
MGGVIPKQFRLLGGKPILLRAAEQLAAVPEIEKIVVVIPRRAARQADALLSTLAAQGSIVLANGGRRRQDSVWSGLLKTDPDCDLVVVHDAVRPLVSPSLIKRCIMAARRHGASVPGLPVTSTIKLVSPAKEVVNTLERNDLWEIQTPQAFRRAILLEAFHNARKEGFLATDDASLVERTGKTIKVIDGEPWNIKITFPSDLVVAEAYLRGLQETL